MKSISPLGNGRWVSPAEAAMLAKNGKGVTLKRMMDKIYSGQLHGFVEQDHLGSWWVFLPEREFQNQPLKAA